jgi:predicted N-acetyltransferase YhbS
MSTPVDAIAIRLAHSTDRAEILELLTRALNWVPDELFDRFFAWKHEANPFGPSPAWVATDGGRIVGFRTFVRWEFDHPDGRTRRAVRAVDTATHPDYQGQHIFQRLTMHGVEELRTDGVDFVFNTPNDKSRPGYLKMGWRAVGRVPAAVRPTGLGAAVRMLRSRVPADRWSLPTTAGHPAPALLGDPRVTTLLASQPRPEGLRTHRSPEYLRWRYGFEALGYRALAPDDDPSRGVAVFRLRRRGAAVEAALCDTLVPGAEPRAAHALERAVARSSGADYVIRLGRSSPQSGYARLPGQGPMLTWRAVAAPDVGPTLADWRLHLGDVELF